MFLASTVNFILATVHEGAIVAKHVMFVRGVFFRNQGIPMVDKLPLVNDFLWNPKLVDTWTGMFEVRVHNM